MIHLDLEVVGCLGNRPLILYPRGQLIGQAEDDLGLYDL